LKTRAAIFAHYDPDGVVDPYAHHYLDALQNVCSKIVFVSTAQMTTEEIRKLENKGIVVIVRENTGYDFMSYRLGLKGLTLLDYDEVILCNDSVYGPFFSLKGVVAAMDEQECDFWGVTESNEICHHLQSYFLVFKKKILNSDIFINFWHNVKTFRNKKDVIRNYEIELTRILITAGFKPACYVHMTVAWPEMLRKFCNNLSMDNFDLRMRGLFQLVKQLMGNEVISCNVTHWFWKEMIVDHQMPFLKIELLRDNPEKLLGVVTYPSVIEQYSSYQVALIQGHLKRVG